MGALGCLIQLHCRARRASGGGDDDRGLRAVIVVRRARHRVRVRVRRVARERGGNGRGGVELDAAALALLIACSELNCRVSSEVIRGFVVRAAAAATARRRGA